MVPLEIELSDDLAEVRTFRTADRCTLLRERDTEFYRFIGEGSAEPTPAACIWTSNRIVGWIDYDDQRDWLGADEVNVGYNVFADDRGRGYATRALRLLKRFLLEQVPPIRPTRRRWPWRFELAFSSPQTSTGSVSSNLARHARNRDCKAIS